MDPSSLTPAWNPHEEPLATNSQMVQTASQPDRPRGPQYPLLDERLVGAQLKVVVNNGESYRDREVIVSIARIEGAVVYNNMFIKALKAWPLRGCLQKAPIRHGTTVFLW